jgi:hypothetical protein
MCNQQCYGITKNLNRCGRTGSWRFFCNDHKRQPLMWLSTLLFTVIAGSLSIYSGLKPVLEDQQEILTVQGDVLIKEGLVLQDNLRIGIVWLYDDGKGDTFFRTPGKQINEGAYIISFQSEPPKSVIGMEYGVRLAVAKLAVYRVNQGGHKGGSSIEEIISVSSETFLFTDIRNSKLGREISRIPQGYSILSSQDLSRSGVEISDGISLVEVAEYLKKANTITIDLTFDGNDSAKFQTRTFF